MRHPPSAVKPFFPMYPIKNLAEATDMTNIETMARA